MIEQAKKHEGYGILKSLPGIGPIRAAQIVATVSTPHRFRTRREFWAYCGFAVVTHSSSDFVFDGPKVRRRHKRVATRGLNRNYNRRLKAVFKGAVREAINEEPFKSYWEQMKAANKNIDIARVCIARKVAAVALAIWKRGEKFDVDRYEHIT
jgi:transposase